MIESTLDLLGKGWVGSILGILGIALAIWFYLKSIKAPKLTVQIETSRMIGWGNHDDLPKTVEVTYQNVKVPRISKVLIRIWNSGTSTLERNLIPVVDQLRIELASKNSQILMSSVIKQSKLANNFRIQISPNNQGLLLINFDYFDPGEGALIGILHTDFESNPIFKGTVKGQKISIIDTGRKRPKIWRMLFKKPLGKARINELILLSLGFAFISLAVLSPNELLAYILYFDAGNDPEKRANLNRLFLSAIGALYILLATFGFWIKRRKFPKHLDLNN